MLRMPSLDAALPALVPSALAAILAALFIGLAAAGGRALAQEGPGTVGSGAVAEIGGEGPERPEADAAGARSGGGSAAWEAAKASVLLGLEEMRADIQLLEAVSALQAGLLEWNGQLVGSGAEPVSLEPSLCEAERMRVWCAVLPATFGRWEEDGDERG